MAEKKTKSSNESSGSKGECICRGCPSFMECGGEPIAFCFHGKSKCIKEKNGCICGGCPIHIRLKFKNHYFCINGTEREQNGGKK